MSFRSLISFILSSSLLISTCIWADQLIVEPEMGRKPILDAIDNARHSIDLVMYGWTDEQLLDAFMQQKKRGKTINIILEEKPYKMEEENNKTILAFKQNHINWIGNVPPFRLIHQKTLVIDDKKALVMTFNFTHSTFKNERNFALILDNPKLVNEITKVFAADFNHKSVTPHDNDLIYSPDTSREQFLALINTAKSKINIYAQDVNDYKIVGALAKAAKRGVQINILTSKNLREKQANYLSRAGIHVYYNKKLYIHAKALVIDDNKAVIGSVNFTRASLDDNRELAIITHDPSVIKELNTQFEKDKNETNPINAFLSHSQNRDRMIKQGMRLLKHFVHEFARSR